MTNPSSDDLPRIFIDGAGLIYNEAGEVVGQEPIRTMTPERIKEQEALQMANTSERLRKYNGNRDSSSKN